MKRCRLPVLALVWLAAGVASAQEWSATYLYRHKITINSSYVSNTLADFPVLIAEGSVKSNLFTRARADGGDILFTTGDGTTRLSHELESYDPAGRKLAAWVKVPSISQSSNTDIYIYYGSAAAGNQQDATNVWANGYVGVWHLNEASTTNADATGRSSGAITNGNVDMIATGKMGGAKAFGLTSFSATNGYLNTRVTEANMNINTSSFTVSVWYKTTSGNQQVLVSDSSNGGATNFKGFELYTTTPTLYGMVASATSNRLSITASDPKDGVWHYAVLLKDRDANTFSLYRDGTFKSSAACVGHVDAGATTKIGSYGGASYFFTGSLDEVRIARALRDGNWIWTEYNNQNNPAAFATAGSEESPPPGCLVGIR